MTTLLTRRRMGALAAAAVFVAFGVGWIGAPAWAGATGSGAAGSGDATAFFKQFADRLVAIVNGPGDTATKRQALQPVIDGDVDVAAIARFCLARFWNTATPAQQQTYVGLFHQVLLNNISGHLGEYQGVSYTMNGEHAEGGSDVVATVINRPNNPPANVSWVIGTASGSPKIIDVVAEGTSMRLQERADYTSYLERHGNSIDQLIAAMQRQLNGS
jgi:phospholipid transport system substrate-binding protein